VKYQHLIDACAGDVHKLAELCLILAAAAVADTMLTRQLNDPKLGVRLKDLHEAVNHIATVTDAPADVAP
jgi:hypothetical protein